MWLSLWWYRSGEAGSVLASSVFRERVPISTAYLVSSALASTSTSLWRAHTVYRVTGHSTGLLPGTHARFFPVV
jgi:hypothetical protein